MNKRHILGVGAFLVLFFLLNLLVAQCNEIQEASAVHKQYIEDYWPIACAMQRKYRVPAYLLVAIGMADSDYGRKEGNNHFNVVLFEEGVQSNRGVDDVRMGYEIMARLISKSLPDDPIPFTDVKTWCTKKMSYNTNETDEYKDRLYRLVKLHNLDKLDAL